VKIRAGQRNLHCAGRCAGRLPARSACSRSTPTRGGKVQAPGFGATHAPGDPVKARGVLPGGILIGYHRKMQGSLFGGANPLYDIPMILVLWHEGRIKLSGLITEKYSLDEINEGYQDLMDGKNIRGVLVHRH
jgi:Zn-dependent alcohol dehydrogenase